MSAVQEIGPFEGRSFENLRAIALLNLSAYGFMVCKNSEYEIVSDLKEHSLNYVYTAQPTPQLKVDSILAVGGVHRRRSGLYVSLGTNGVDDFISGNFDSEFFSLDGGKPREADTNMGIRWLALDDITEDEEAMRRLIPMAYIKTIEPAKDAVGIDKPTPMMGYCHVLVASKTVPDGVVQRIIKAMRDSPDKVRNINRSFPRFTPDSMVPKFPGIILYEGA
jgi:hypothetical protein